MTELLTAAAEDDEVPPKLLMELAAPLRERLSRPHNPPLRQNDVECCVREDVLGGEDRVQHEA